MAEKYAFTSYKVDNDRKFRSAIAQAAAQVGDLTIPFTLISRDFYRSEKAIFQLSGPGQYPDFKDGGDKSPYAKWKQAKYGFKYPLLKATGDLERSVTDPSDSQAINFISNQGRTLTIGTTVPYAGYHQSDEPRKKVPLRKFLFIGPEAAQFATSDQMGRLERWTNTINGYVKQKLALIGTVQ